MHGVYGGFGYNIEGLKNKRVRPSIVGSINQKKKVDSAYNFEKKNALEMEH